MNPISLPDSSEGDPTNMHLLNPERLRAISSVMSRYSEHLAPGHRIRLGMKGDPCASHYRSGQPRATATVTDLHREPNGEIRFHARLDNSDAVVYLSNRSIAPGDLWEVASDPGSMETFRQTVQENIQEAEDERYDTREEGESRYMGVTETAYRSSVESHFSRLENTIHDMENVNKHFRETMASTIRALAGDLVLAARGNPIEFAHQYADRYDMAVTERSMDAPAPSSFRGDGEATRDVQSEKFDFDVYEGAPEAEADSQVSD